MPPPTDGPHAGDPPTVLQSADVVELNRALAELLEENARLTGERDAVIAQYGDPDESETLAEVVKHLHALCNHGWGEAGRAIEKLAQRDARICDLEAVIEADRTRIIDGVNALDKVLHGRFWLTEGRGSYEWNDDRYRKEFGDAARAVLKAVEPLRKIGADLTNCPPTTDEVIAARRNKDARIGELERALREWSELAEHLDLSTQSHRNRTRDLLDSTSAPEPREESCHICGKQKGQPPERCPGHYSGTPSDPANFASTPAGFTPAPEHPDTRRLDKLQSLGDNLELVIDNDLIGERIVLSWNAWSGRSLRDEIDAMKEATDA